MSNIRLGRGGLGRDSPFSHPSDLSSFFSLHPLCGSSTLLAFLFSPFLFLHIFLLLFLFHSFSSLLSCLVDFIFLCHLFFSFFLPLLHFPNNCTDWVVHGSGLRCVDFHPSPKIKQTNSPPPPSNQIKLCCTNCLGSGCIGNPTSQFLYLDPALAGGGSC